MWRDRLSPDVKSPWTHAPRMPRQRRLGSAFSDSLSRAAPLVNCVVTGARMHPAADRDKAGVILGNATIGISFDALGYLFQEFVAPKLLVNAPTCGGCKTNWLVYTNNFKLQIPPESSACHRPLPKTFLELPAII